jgi:hypothetical protein
MAEEIKVTVIFLIPTDSGGFQPQKFYNVIVNTRATIERLKPALIKAFPEVDIGNPQDVELMIQAPDGSNLSNVPIQDQSTIVIYPKYSGPLVKR